MKKKKRSSLNEVLLCLIVTSVLSVLMLGNGLHSLNDPYEYRTGKGVLRSFETEKDIASTRNRVEFEDNLELNIDGRILNIAVSRLPETSLGLAGTEYSMSEIQEILKPCIGSTIEYTYRHGKSDAIVQLTVGNVEVVNRDMEANRQRNNALGFCWFGIALAILSLGLMVHYFKMPHRRKKHARSHSRRTVQSRR